MEWDKLLNPGRFREHSQPPSEFEGRSEFENDYTRLIFSSAVRRLQDKAQVFPLESSDFVRTRLTHSLEVSALGRSIGASVEDQLIKRDDLNPKHKGEIGAILASVGLIHDLGNPPFGHFGEIVIQSYFKNWFEAGNGKELSPEQQGDFLNFEGNAQTFRLIKKLQYLIDNNGFNLTFATLASSIKYPRSSIEGNRDNGRISYKKFGYFQSEADAFARIAMETGIALHRHPIAFLLEAADDIAYSAADIEDGLKKGVLNYEIIRSVLEENLDVKYSEKDQLLMKKLNDYHAAIHENYPDRTELAIQRIRIAAQGYMIESVVKTFVDRQKDILSGGFDEDIILASEAKNVRKAFKRLAAIIFSDKAIISREIIGEKVICTLLDLFIGAVVSDNRYKGNTKEGKLYSLMSSNYRFLAENFPDSRDEKGEPSLYDRLLLVTDFICGMTDTYAWDLYQKLTGIRL